MTLRLPDPHGMIARARARLPKNCSVKLSPYCDHILALRMQGVAYDKIEEWLEKRGEQYKIPKATLWRNLQPAKAQVEVHLPLAEEIAERWGGVIDIDAARELARTILLQRKRVDAMIRQETERKKDQGNQNYFDKRIRAEMETLNGLITSFFRVMKNPMDAADERKSADDLLKDGKKVAMTPEIAEQLSEFVLSGGLTFDTSDGNTKPS